MYYTKLGEHTVNAVRLAEILQVLVRHGFADLLRRAGFHDGLPARLLRTLRLVEAPAGEPATFGERLCDALTELGPTYIKLGQVLSTRPDLVGSSVADALNQLQDQVDPIPFDEIAPVFEADLGKNVSELYDVFDKVPVASASLSQVYRARLHTGDDVAVKVQRPRTEQIIESDLRLMRQLAEWIAGRVEEANWFDPVGIVEEFSRSVRRELDFTIEARVIEQFRANFEGDNRVFIPGVFRECSGTRVLTMGWVDGVRIDRFDLYAARRCDRSTMAVIACEILCRMVFEHRLFHADPHPGNIFITHDNGMAFLDLGMAGHLEESDVGAIADLLLTMFHGDSAECVNAVMALTTERGPFDRTALEHEVADFIAFEAHTIIGGGQVMKGIERAVEILRRYNMELAPRFSLLLKALGTVESVGRNLDPGIDFVTIIQPFVEKFIYSRYRPKYVFRELTRNAMALLRLSRQLPDDVSNLLQQLRKGRLKFQVHHEHLENLAATIDRSSNRNSMAMITAALIVGSSLLITTDSYLSFLGLGGYVFAGILGFALIISILWSRRF